MKEYDVVVIGSGSGSEIVENALRHDAHVALVDIPPIGGTCQNFGCIPSKMLIYPADIIAMIQESKHLDISAHIDHVDFLQLMKRMRHVRKQSQDHQRRFVQKAPHFDYYEGKASFIDQDVIAVNDQNIKGEKIFIANGARPLIPLIEGIEDVEYLTNETLLDLDKAPESMIIIGGGYVAVEYAHFFSAMGTRITIIEQGDRLVSEEEPEISDLLKVSLRKRMKVVTGVTAVKVTYKQETYTVLGQHNNDDKQESFSAESLLVAAGRTSNADTLGLDHTRVDLSDDGYIKVNEFMETTQSNVWAIGDITGNHMFKHVANQEAYIAGNNAFHEEQMKMEYHAVPHAIYSHPQIASVGMTQQIAGKNGYDIMVGFAGYGDIAKGEAMNEKDGFAKAIVDKDSWSVLGFHIIGPYAPMIIQEVITIMNLGGQIGHIGSPMHIHPSLPELIQHTLANLTEVT